MVKHGEAHFHAIQYHLLDITKDTLWMWSWERERNEITESNLISMISIFFSLSSLIIHSFLMLTLHLISFPYCDINTISSYRQKILLDQMEMHKRWGQSVCSSYRMVEALHSLTITAIMVILWNEWSLLSHLSDSTDAQNRARFGRNNIC